MSYSTGEIAELCGITVRTVQFYDKEGLLKPETLSEGGRRLYGENELKTMQIICMYKSLGLSLSEIKDVLSGGDGLAIISDVLDDKENSALHEIENAKERLECIRAVKRHFAERSAISPKIFFDVQNVMKGQQKLKLVYAIMIVLTVLSFIAGIAFIVLWAVWGMWLPLAVGMPCVIAAMVALTGIYFKNTAYICRECCKKFKPKFLEMFFAPHTPKTRKLKCPYCGCKKYHTETYCD